MKYGQVFYADPANGIGCRTSLFVSGCRHHCKGCFNPETWSFDYGKEFDCDVESDIIRSMDSPFIDGLSILGGEPMEPENQEVLRRFIARVRYVLPEKTIWIYTGCRYEDLLYGRTEYSTLDTMPILEMTDILVDGAFIEEEKDITLRFRGSRNQRIIDVQKTLSSGKIVLSSLGDK